MRDFHDNQYDGIVLKIPRGFILTNPTLVENINSFEQALQSCEFSVFHPDHERNLFELKNYKNKVEHLKAERQAREDRENTIKEREDRRCAFIELPVIDDTITFTSGVEHLWVNGRRVEYDEYATARSGMSKTISNECKKFFSSCSMDEFLEWVKLNKFHINPEWISPLFNHKRCEVYLDGYDNLTLRYYIKRLEMWSRGKRKRGNIYANTAILAYSNKHKEYFIDGRRFDGMAETIKEGDTSTKTWLDEYKFNGNFTLLIKQKS